MGHGTGYEGQGMKDRVHGTGRGQGGTCDKQGTRDEGQEMRGDMGQAGDKGRG